MHKVISPHTHHLMQTFRQAEVDFIGSTGWHILAIPTADVPSLPVEILEPRLAIIKAHIYTRKDWLKAGMNNARIAISRQLSKLPEGTFTVAV